MGKVLKAGIWILILILAASIVAAWTPTSNIDGKNFYKIFNITNVSAGKLFDDGHRVLTNETILNVNSSVWWDGEDSQADLNVNSSEYWDEETSQADLNVNGSVWWSGLSATTQITAIGTIVTGVWHATQIADAYLAALNANKLTNLSYLNYKILSYWENITNHPTNLSQFTDDISSGLNVNSSVWWDEEDSQADLNVNSSQYWKALSEPSDLNYKILSYWENITGRPTFLSNFTDDLDYSDKNVNSSQYWKELSVPSDLNGRVLVYWENVTGRPTLLSNFTDDLGDRGYTLLSNFTDDLGDRGYTLLSNFTDDLGARGYTLLSNFTDDLDYSDKNVNRSDYWDGLGVPADLNNKITLDCKNITASSGNLCLNQTLEANNYADTLQITTIYNATGISTVIGTPQGTIGMIQVYDGISYNVSEVNSDLDFRVNFSGITEFNQLIVRYKSDAAESQTMDIAIWRNDTGIWESYRTVGVSSQYNLFTMNVYDFEEHIIAGGVVQVRFYSSNVGALVHKHYFDWVAISKGPATPSSSETDPYSIHKDGNVQLTGEWNAGKNITAPGFNGYLNGTARNATGWDGISSQSEITHTGNLTSLNVTGNISAPWFNGQVLWSYIANKFITAVGNFFYMSGTTLEMNTTVLNATIDERVAVASNLSTDGGIKLDGTTFSVLAGNGLEQETYGLKVADAGINDTLMQYKLGQNLTASDSPGFTNMALSGTLNPSSNTTFGKGWIIPQGEYGCFDASCNHYIFENNSGVLIIV